MDYDPSCTSPNPYVGGGGGSIYLVCEECHNGDNYSDEDAEDGFFVCRTCSARHTVQATDPDPYDFPTTGNVAVRRVAKLSEPWDFAPGAGTWGELEDLAARVRWCYVRGLQVTLQCQLEALVERHQVAALVCAVAGPVWVRWVAASKVCDEAWVRQVLTDHVATAREKRSGGVDNKKPDEVKYEWGDDILPRQKDRRKVEFAFLRSLRMKLPVYSTLAVCFLACHIAREAILPSDIYRWAMEGNVPYVAAFTEVDRFLGSSLLQDCPFDTRQLFRPVRVIGAWQLEAAAGSIAERVGLSLPSVNFYEIAQRCLNDLSMPIDRILPHACQIYQWAMPAELWLSSNPARIPARVCVMAILIVSLRIMYNINGQGIWEKICEEGRNTIGTYTTTTTTKPFIPKQVGVG